MQYTSKLHKMLCSARPEATHKYERKRKRSDSVLWQNPLHSQKKSINQRDNTKNVTKNFDYTTIVDRLRTVSWSNNSHPTGVLKSVYERSTFLLTTTAVQSKEHTFKNVLIILLIETEDGTHFAAIF